jgi:hypothetical protein
MFRTIVLSLLVAGATGTAVARDNDRWGGNNDRQYQSDRYDRRDSRHDDRRDDRRDHRYEGWRDQPRYDYRAAPRYYRPTPRYFRPAPRPYGWYPGWREPYARGYRYWNQDRYYYAEPGRPAVELSFVLPL